MVCNLKKCIGLTYNIMHHFVHFEVEGIYNFKLVNVYKIHKTLKYEQLLMLQYYFCARNKSLILTLKRQLGVNVTNGDLGVVPLILVITSFNVLTRVSV